MRVVLRVSLLVETDDGELAQLQRCIYVVSGSVAGLAMTKRPQQGRAVVCSMCDWYVT